MCSRKIDFIIPTYNAEKHLSLCLKSIVRQHFPRRKIGIIVVDGGSADKTIEIAKSFGAEIYPNTKRLAEYGVQRGMAEADGELVVVFAADNELVSDDWIQRVVDIFERDHAISAVWGKLVSGGNDPTLNKYLELIQSDPLNWFLNKNLDRYKTKAQVYREKCFIFKVDPAKPLVWGANGLVYRMEKIKAIWAQEGYLGDNDAFQYMIEQGDNKVAYFDIPFVYHHHVSKLGDWVVKWERNFTRHLLDKQETRNMNWIFTSNFKLKLFFWIIYSLVPVFSLLDSMRNMIRDHNIYWLYHAPACFLQTSTYIKATFLAGKWKQVFSLGD